MKINPDKLHFIPLGGCGEVGMNLNVYVCQGKALIVDCGVMFSGQDDGALSPEIDSLLSLVDDVLGIIITHAHQDHIGAIQDLWPDLRCPIYASRFAIEMIYKALDETHFRTQVPVRVLGLQESFTLGPFHLQRIPLTHSTIEMGAYVIRAAGSTVLHTGDWTFDPDPVVGQLSDITALENLGTLGVDALICDSTNAMESGWTGSEGSIRAELRTQILAASGRVFVTLFSSNVARIKLLADLAMETGRTFVVLGRSLHTVIRAAQTAGYLDDLPINVSPKQFGYLPSGRVLVVCTGSQGSPNSMLGRLAKDRRDDVYLEPGDTVLFSARRIPGCEADIDVVQAQLRARRIRVVDERDAMIHVSGHPRQDELQEMYRLVKPRCIVPVHGTEDHLNGHSQFAKDLGFITNQTNNGDVLAIGPVCEKVARISTGRRRRRIPEK